ncbi:MAG: hypothetical protein R3C15_23815 [Thermoleophilia bacterium]
MDAYVVEAAVAEAVDVAVLEVDGASVGGGGVEDELGDGEVAVDEDPGDVVDVVGEALDVGREERAQGVVAADGLGVEGEADRRVLLEAGDDVVDPLLVDGAEVVEDQLLVVLAPVRQASAARIGAVSA